MARSTRGKRETHSQVRVPRVGRRASKLDSYARMEAMDPNEIDDELRMAMRDASSASWSVRKEAGRRLAVRAEAPGVAEILQQLLLDDQDTAVTQATADALLGRRDRYGLRLILVAFFCASVPSFPESSTVDQLYSAIMSDSRWMTEVGREQLSSQLGELLLDSEESVRREAQKLLELSRRFD